MGRTALWRDRRGIRVIAASAECRLLAGTRGTSTGLEQPEQEEAANGSGSKHSGRALTREIRCSTHELVDRLILEFSRELLHPLAGITDQGRHLGRVPVQIICRQPS